MKSSPSSQSRILNESAFRDLVYGDTRYYSGHTNTTYPGVRSVTFLQSRKEKETREKMKNESPKTG